MTYHCPALLAYYWGNESKLGFDKETVNNHNSYLLPQSFPAWSSHIWYFLIKFPIKITFNSLDKYITIQADKSSFDVSFTNNFVNTSSKPIHVTSAQDDEKHTDAHKTSSDSVKI